MPYVIFISSLIMPIYTLIFAILETIKKRSSYLSLFSVAITFATIVYVLVPSEALDLYRHYQRVDVVQSLTFNDVLKFSSSGYRLFDLYAWFLGRINLEKPAFNSSLVFLGYYLVLLVFNDIKINYLFESNNTIRFYIFTVFLLSVDFIFLATGIRNVLANIMVFYFTYHAIFHKKNLNLLMGCMLAFFIHPASFLPSAIVLVSLVLPSISRYSRYILIVGFMLILFNSFVNTILSYIDSLARILPFYDPIYLDSDSVWGGSYSEYASTSGWIASFIIYRLPTYIGLIYLLYLKPQRDNALYTILCITILFLSLTFSFAIVFLRLNYFFIYLFAAFISIEYAKKSNKVNLFFIFLYILSLLGIWVVNIFAFDFYVFSSLDYLYKPLIFIIGGL